MSDKNAAEREPKAAASACAPAPVPARITLLYESRDKRLCLFEDANGHLTAVRATRLA